MTEVSFFDPAQEAKIKQRRALAKMLQAQGGPKQTEMVGGFAVPQSGLEQFSRALSQGLGTYQGAVADMQEKDLATQKQKLLVEALQQPDAKSAAGILSQDPSMAKEALDIAFPRSSFGSTPAALQLANEVARLEASGDTAGANRIREFAKTQEKGQTIVNGGIAQIPGYDEAVASKEAAKAGGKVIGASDAKTQLALPGDTRKANYAVQLVDEMVGNQDKGIAEHPGMRGAVGLSSMIPSRRGSNARDFENRLDQIGGKQFLEAFESLKGGGQITEIEGKKATDAIARMKASGSEEEFIAAAREFQDTIKQGLAAKQARVGVSPSAPAAPATPPNIPPEAKQAPDGNFYIPDPARPGKYLKVN